MGSNHDDNNDLAIPPIWTADKKGTPLAHFCLSFHHLFGPFDEQQLNQKFSVGRRGQARQQHLDVTRGDEQILGPGLHRDLALRDHVIVGIPKRTTERRVVPSQPRRQIEDLARVRRVEQTTPSPNRRMNRPGKRTK